MTPYAKRELQVFIIRTAIIAITVAALMWMLSACTGAYRMQQPLGPVKGDRFPACDEAKQNCVRT
jgi:hypothetical protein